jgi:Exonuclease VII small subunit.
MTTPKNKSTDSLKYSDAIKRLEEIVSNIENEEYDIDVLTDYVAEATKLIAFCKSKLHRTEEDINKILSAEN